MFFFCNKGFVKQWLALVSFVFSQTLIEIAKDQEA